MADPRFQMEAEAGLDDLPRTLRREHEARQREQRERDARERGPAFNEPGFTSPPFNGLDGGLQEPGFGGAEQEAAYPTFAQEPVAASVRRIEVPFFALMVFFLKAVLAAIPALIVLGAILWAAGEILQTFFPWLIKMKITIAFPG